MMPRCGGTKAAELVLEGTRVDRTSPFLRSHAPASTPPGKPSQCSSFRTLPAQEDGAARALDHTGPQVTLCGSLLSHHFGLYPEGGRSRGRLVLG